MSDDDHSLLASMLRKKLKTDYELNQDWKITSIRRSMIEKWKRRADYQAMVMMQEHGPDML